MRRLAVMTVTSTIPEPAGATAVIELSLVTVNEAGLGLLRT